MSEKRGEYGVVDAVILVRCVPDDLLGANGLDDLPDILAVDTAGNVTGSTTQHPGIEKSIFLLFVDDM